MSRVDMTPRISALAPLALLAALAPLASGCHIFDRHHPPGHPARAQLGAGAFQAAEGSDFITPQWSEAMSAFDLQRPSFSARETDKAQHVWVHYSCAVASELNLTGTVGYTLGAPASRTVEPVPVTITAQGATVSGLPRGAGDAFPVGNQTRTNASGMREVHGYVYLFDIPPGAAASTAITGQLQTPSGVDCRSSGSLTYEIWVD